MGRFECGVQEAFTEPSKRNWRLPSGRKLLGTQLRSLNKTGYCKHGKLVRAEQADDSDWMITPCSLQLHCPVLIRSL